ncbi:MAG: hypothetical protein COW62_10170, partial [Zetaproteobacteria bacterium CG17_big_fil_post_rev_8_21_14_2_50_50_13]
MSVFQSFLVWLPGTLLLIYVASIDLFPIEQFLLSFFCACGLILSYVIQRIKKRLNKDHSLLSLARLSFMVIGGFVAIRYLIWRVQFSIPWNEDPFSLFCSLALLVAELMGVLLSVMGAFINIHPLRREFLPVSLDDERLPTVDVLVPSYNESSALLRTTLLAATNIEYPKRKLNVYLLDDGGTDEKCAQAGARGEEAKQRKQLLQQLSEEVGCYYLTRPNNHQAKAGNINAALPHISGEIVVILDADHVPAIDFLEKTVGSIMHDDSVAIVQTPHFMLNRDPIEKNLKVIDQMPGEGEMFYTMNLRGMDNWNSGFFCGSGALIRRSALDEIGGILTNTIVEDAETSLELLTRGYKTRYLHRPLLAGLSAESLPSFIVQRTRWATGMMQLLRYRNPLFLKNRNYSALSVVRHIATLQKQSLTW